MSICRRRRQSSCNVLNTLLLLGEEQKRLLQQASEAPVEEDVFVFLRAAAVRLAHWSCFDDAFYKWTFRLILHYFNPIHSITLSLSLSLSLCLVLWADVRVQIAVV